MELGLVKMQPPTLVPVVHPMVVLSSCPILHNTMHTSFTWRLTSRLQCAPSHLQLIIRMIDEILKLLNIIAPWLQARGCNGQIFSTREKTLLQMRPSNKDLDVFTYVCLITSLRLLLTHFTAILRCIDPLENIPK